MKSEEHISLEEQLFGHYTLEDIMEVEEKSLEKEQLIEQVEHNESDLAANYSHRNLMSLEEVEFKGTRHFEIANPSPCYRQSSTSFFDDLVVIGTQLKMLTPRASPHRESLPEEQERKQSEDNFIEEILEINFDP
jgi:hypothetical protein